MPFFDPGKPIKFPAITYSFYPVYANVFGIEYETVPLCADFSLDVTKFFEAEGGVIFPNPNAPTSVYLPLEQVEKIVKANPEKVVIVDEAYMDFAPGESAASLVQKYGNLLVIQTMSKSRSLAGLRLGFALGNEGLIQALVRMKDSFNSYPIDRLAMAGATAAIRDRDYLAKTTSAIVKTREWTTTKLKQLGFCVLPSATNFVFASHPDVAAEAIYEALRDKGILIRYFATKPIDDYVRISIGTDDEMKRFVSATKVILNKI
jgi:histidinol-phosphate aminotransferase